MDGLALCKAKGLCSDILPMLMQQVSVDPILACNTTLLKVTFVTFTF
jgi:hypothetical protein